MMCSVIGLFILCDVSIRGVVKQYTNQSLFTFSDQILMATVSMHVHNRRACTQCSTCNALSARHFMCFHQVCGGQFWCLRLCTQQRETSTHILCRSHQILDVFRQIGGQIVTFARPPMVEHPTTQLTLTGLAKGANQLAHAFSMAPPHHYREVWWCFPHPSSHVEL